MKLSILTKKKGVGPLSEELELPLMEILWAKGSMKGRALYEEIRRKRDIAYTTALTVLSPEVAQIANFLTRPGETLPLVIGSARKGAFRRSCAYWVTTNTVEPIRDFQDLQSRVKHWDGRLPAPDKIMSATQLAQREAERQVRLLEGSVSGIEAANISSQLEAASLRLIREVGRLLRCLDSTSADIASLAENQAARTGPLADRIRQAKDWLGGEFQWTEQLRWELDQFIRNLTPNDRKARLSGSTIDAALA